MLRSDNFNIIIPTTRSKSTTTTSTATTTASAATAAENAFSTAATELTTNLKSVASTASICLATLWTGANARNDEPSAFWKTKQRVQYCDEVEKLRHEPTISTDIAGDQTTATATATAPTSATSPTRTGSTKELRPLLRRTPSTQSVRSYRSKAPKAEGNRNTNSTCSHCGAAQCVPTGNNSGGNMTPHPISPLARSTVNLAVPTEQRQSLMPPPSNAHHGNGGAANGGGMQREDSFTLAVPQVYHVSRRPSVLLHDILAKRPSVLFGRSKKKEAIGSLNGTATGSMVTIHTPGGSEGAKSFQAKQQKEKNRRQANDAISAAVSATYCKLLVLLGVCLPITVVISDQIPTYIYQGFYVYLYLGSIAFVIFLYVSAYRNRTLFNALKDYHARNNNVHLKHKVHHFGSFYLRVGAIAFAIGTMVYSGLEFGQFFELNGMPGCHDIFVAITPICRMVLCIVQVQFIFLNTTYLDMARHKVTSRFGLMHMVATNLCEWLYVLVEETKHEIFHIQQHEQAAHEHNAAFDASVTQAPVNWAAVNASIANSGQNFSNEALSILNSLAAMATASGNVTGTSTSSDDNVMLLDHSLKGCSRTNIMGELVQAVSPFLFPCTIEYSLICAVILYEMWKSVRSIPEIDRTRKHSLKPTVQRPAHQFSVDCSQSHKGLFFGILIMVMTIISMIMYFVLYTQPGYQLISTQEVTLWETVMYVLCCLAIGAGMYMMRDLRFVQGSDEHHSMDLDNLLLVLAQTGVYLYSMFTILGSAFSPWDTVPDRVEGIIAEVFDLVETSLQTMFILHASHRRCKGSTQARRKPGREIITFLLVANIAIWLINTLIKGRAVFRATHLIFYGVWGWTIITHISMPLAIFYRFHSTICLFEVWKVAYKAKAH